MADPLAALEARLGHRFRDRLLLEAALTHRSHAYELASDVHSERLEFLGDAVLGLLVSDRLFRAAPESPEGELSRAKSALVSEAALARWARRLELGAALRLGVGEARSGGHDKDSLLADALEAVLGAIHLEEGQGALRALIAAHIADETDADPIAESPRDPKTRLQELAQSRGWPLPTYLVLEATGPDHDKRFGVAVEVDGERIGSGLGRSKKQAEQAAAAAGLERLAGSGAAEDAR